MPRPVRVRTPLPGELATLDRIVSELATLKAGYLAERDKLRRERAAEVSRLRAGGWTVRQLADAKEITPSALNQWENPPPEPDEDGDPGAGVH